MTRSEHMQWCKNRALEYIKDGDINGGITSMMSDIRKHNETESDALSSLCMMMLMSGQLETTAQAEKFINGFTA